MPEQVPFISREAELALIDTLIGEWGTMKMLCIYAPGGIGKTRLLQEVPKRYPRSERTRLIIAGIIDFDDRTFHTPANVERKIAEMLKSEVDISQNDIVQPYMEHLIDYRKRKMAGVSAERLQQQYVHGNALFVECFNKVSEQKRIVLSIDTTDAIEGADFWDYLIKMASRLRNALILIAGRNARETGDFLQPNFGQDAVQLIELPKLEEKASEEYLQQKQALLHVEFDPDLRQKLLLLAEGKPILIDLAAEWLARNIPFDWLVQSSLTELQALSGNERQKRQEQFERQLVLHIAREQSDIDTLILWMSRIYPLNVRMVATFLNMSEQMAEQLFAEAQSYAFIKRLPDGRLSLHDEMRRMIREHTWPEVDPEGDRWRRDLQLILTYLEQQVNYLSEKIEERKNELKKIEKQEEAAADSLKMSLEIHETEQRLWVAKKQQFEYTLAENIDRGFNLFLKLFDEATKASNFALRQQLFETLQKHSEKLSSEQRCILDIRQIQLFFDHGRIESYHQARMLGEQVLKKLEEVNISAEYQVDTLLKVGNIKIRLGNVREGIEDFKKALNISTSTKLLLWQVKTTNALGWAYRLVGNSELAQKYYHEARQLCFRDGGLDDPALQVVYGWISNNLAFILSNKHKTRATAIDLALSAIEHWRSIENDIGLGAGYFVLGVAYYRNDASSLALKAFQDAINIFEPLKLNDWLGQIYSWRGAQYHHIRESDRAKRDLEKALEIGSPNIEAMTLNRLGRVYMLQKEWDNAEDCLMRSFKRAQEIPDTVYWLASVGRLATIAAERGEYHRLEEFEQMLNTCIDDINKIGKVDQSTLGIAYLGLAKLAFGQSDPGRVQTIVKFLREGITLITENGPYSHTDICNRLNEFKKHHFHKLPPVTIQSIGQILQEYIRQKENEDITYSIVTPIMYEWATWKGEEKTDE